MRRGNFIPGTRQYANVDEEFCTESALCNINVARNGLVSIAPQVPSEDGQAIATRFLGAAVDRYKTDGVATIDLAKGANSKHVVNRISGHRRQPNSNKIEYSVTWESDEQTWEPAHLLLSAQGHVEAFLATANPLPFNGVFVGDWLSFRFGPKKPAGFLQLPQFAGRDNAQMQLELEHVQALLPSKQDWLTVEGLCHGLSHLLTCCGWVAPNVAVFDPTAWCNFRTCKDQDKHYMLCRTIDIMDKDWWILPVCWSGCDVLTHRSRLGFSATGSHWSLFVVAKVKGASPSVLHFDPLGSSRATSTVKMLTAELAWFIGKSVETVELPTLPTQPGGWECGFFALLFVEHLLAAIKLLVPLRKMVFSFSGQCIPGLKARLLASVLSSSSLDLGTFCKAGEDSGAPCAFVVRHLEVISGQRWCHLVAGARMFWCNLGNCNVDGDCTFEQLCTPQCL